MNIDKAFTYFIVLVFGAVGLTLVVNAFKYGGVKAAMFGARIVKTVDEIDLARRGVSSTKLRVHILQADTENKVGLEIVSKSIASYSMAPFTLSRENAGQLVRLLQSATGA
jgi:hypothetical protein